MKVSYLTIALVAAISASSAQAEPFKSTKANWDRAAETVNANLKKLKEAS